MAKGGPFTMTGPGEESGGSSANLFSPQRLDPLRARLIQSGLGGEQVADVLQKARSRIMHQCQRVVAENPDLVGEIQQHEMLSGPVDEAAIDEPLMVTVALYLQKRAMRQLPPQQQEALLLHANEAMSHREIARQLGVSRDKALCILAKAYADLQLSLRGSQPESAFGEESCVDSRGTACVEKSIRVSAAQFLLQWRAGDRRIVEVAPVSRCLRGHGLAAWPVEAV
jgi:hypothetical protein